MKLLNNSFGVMEEEGVQYPVLVTDDFKVWFKDLKCTKVPTYANVCRMLREGLDVMVYKDWSFVMIVTEDDVAEIKVTIHNPNFHDIVDKVFKNELVQIYLTTNIVEKDGDSKLFELLRNYNSGNDEKFMKKVEKIFKKYLPKKVEETEEMDDGDELHFDEQCRLKEVLENGTDTLVGEMVEVQDVDTNG